MRPTYLTKSDFQAARNCPTKLYYRHLDYPTTGDNNALLAYMAEQGYLVEALARRHYPDGVLSRAGGSLEEMAQATLTALARAENVTLFEATLTSGRNLARVDILDKRGSTLRLVEVKSRSVNGSAGASTFWTKQADPQVRADWRPYFEDIAFQWLVLRELFPSATITPFLILLDGNARSRADGLHRLTSANAAGSFADDAIPLIELDVAREVEAVLPDVQSVRDYLLSGLVPELRRLAPQLSTRCRDCEYRLPTTTSSGFHECWDELADVSPHILDLYSVGTAGGNGDEFVSRMVASGKAGLLDIAEAELVGQVGWGGAQANRQLRQIRQTRLNQEWIDPGLMTMLDNVAYPLHFVDFETCAPTIPRYQGMRPFDTVAFQWSCHTLAGASGVAIHADWLQEQDTYPNLDFAEALRERLGDNGTVVVWSNHERTVLQAIRRQLAEMACCEDQRAWLDSLIHGDRLLDLHRWAARHYYHPRMGGKATVKSVCEAVWVESAWLRARYPEFAGDLDVVQSPYRSLPALTINGSEAVVDHGTGAILAYMRMMGDQGEPSAMDQAHWRQLLRQYCRLDTLAMVMIWEHWQQRCTPET